MSGNQDSSGSSANTGGSGSSSSSPDNLGRELGKALANARQKATERGQTGRRG